MTGGHLGIKKTLTQVARRAYFVSWQMTVKLVCKSCTQCCRYSGRKLRHQGQMMVNEPLHTMDRLDVDLTGPHPRSASGHVYIMTAIDAFSRFLFAVPLRNKTAKTVAEALFKHIFCKFGTVRRILTDQGKEFDNALLHNLCNLFGIRKIRTTAYNPAANGRIERTHRTLNSILAKLIDTNQRNWHEVLDFAVAAFNATENGSTSLSPNFVMFGRELLTPFDLLSAPIPDGSPPLLDEYVLNLKETIEKTSEIVRQRTHSSAEQRKRRYDRNIRKAEFQLRTLVWVYHPRNFKGRSPKWTSKFIGPALIERRINSVLFVVRLAPKGRSSVVHIDKLKPYVGETPAVWREFIQSPETSRS